MKKIFVLGMLLAAIAMQSCDKGFTDLNTDPTKTTEAYPQQFMANALMKSVEYNMIRNRNFNNELMQVTVDFGDGDGKVFRYDFRRNWADYLWNGHFTNLSNYKDMYTKALNPLIANRAYQAVSLICQSWTYSILTDTYGDIPYLESNLGRDSLILEPKFDKQKDIYVDMIAKLDSANTLLRAVGSNTTEVIDPTSDPVYAGDRTKWRKFGNSLMLRLMLRIAHKPEMAPYVAKIQEMLGTAAAIYPIMTSNADAAILRWTGTGAILSPYQQSVRVQDFRAISLASFFIDFLKNTNDPRIDIPLYNSLYGTTGNNNRWGIAAVNGDYLGVPSGYSASGPEFGRQSYFLSSDQGYAVSLQTEPMSGMIMNFAEVELIKAELALKGIISADPKTFFYSGADNGIKLWMPGWTKPIQQHLMEADIDWNEAETFDQKMDKIHMQKYLALFMTDMQQWFEYRRTGHPKLPKPEDYGVPNGLKNGGEMPARLYYPVYVQSSNPSNYQLVLQQQGPDEINTKVWWQKP